MSTPTAPVSPSAEAIVETMAQAMATSAGASLEDAGVANHYRNLARAAFASIFDGEHTLKTAFGLRNDDGITFECKDLQEAKEFKSGSSGRAYRSD